MANWLNFQTPKMTKIFPNFDPEIDEGPVPSPCISICKIDPQHAICIACYRSLDEIAAWSRINDDTKRAVWKQIHLRKKQISSF